VPWITLSETLTIDAPAREGAGANDRWAVQIEGAADDIHDLTSSLKEAQADIDLRIVMVSGIAALSASGWDYIDDPAQIQALSETSLNNCVGCLNLLNICGWLKIGTIYEFRNDKLCTMTRYSLSKVNIKKSIEDRAPSQVFLSLLKFAQTETWFASCLPLYSQEPDFYIVYKAVESISRYCGGEHKMKGRSDINGAKLAKIKNVADYHRHIQKPERAKPTPFFSLQESVEIVSKSIEMLLKDSQLK
jgi:hypothetical protein